MNFQDPIGQMRHDQCQMERYLSATIHKCRWRMRYGRQAMTMAGQRLHATTSTLLIMCSYYTEMKKKVLWQKEYFE